MWTNHGIGSTWQNALAYCEGLEYAGYTDWRLPNINEMLSIFDPALDPASSAFDSYHPWYWTSSYLNDPSDELSSMIGPFHIENSEMDTIYTTTMNHSFNFVCVRNAVECNSGYFWNGRKCLNPCDLCGSDPNSTGECLGATSLTEYTCGCASGYFWTGSQCRSGAKWSFENGGDDTSSGAVSVNNSAEYHWERMTALGAMTGSYAMCSNNYNVGSSTAEMTVTVNMPSAGTLSFYIKGSGEYGWDIFHLDVDETTDALTSSGISGWENWTLQSFDLTAGIHTLTFRYAKDSSVDSDVDRFCIDDLIITW